MIHVFLCITGVDFATEVGCLSVGSRGGNYITALKEVVQKDGIQAETLSGTEVCSKFPFLSIPNMDESVFESHFAGYISPRRLIKAQITIAKKNGCQHIQEAVRSVSRVLHDDSNKVVMEVVTDSGRKVLAKKVLLCTGAFTAFRKLIGTEVSPDTKLFPLAVTKLEISEEDAVKIKCVVKFIRLLFRINPMQQLRYRHPFLSERCHRFCTLGKEELIGPRTTPWIPEHLLSSTCFHQFAIPMVKYQCLARRIILQQPKSRFCARLLQIINYDTCTTFVRGIHTVLSIDCLLFTVTLENISSYGDVTITYERSIAKSKPQLGTHGL